MSAICTNSFDSRGSEFHNEVEVGGTPGKVRHYPPTTLPLKIIQYFNTKVNLIFSKLSCYSKFALENTIIFHNTIKIRSTRFGSASRKYANICGA